MLWLLICPQYMWSSVANPMHHLLINMVIRAHTLTQNDTRAHPPKCIHEALSKEIIRTSQEPIVPDLKL